MKELKLVIIITNSIILFFFSFYLLKWEPTIIGVFRELLILPCFLIQFILAVYILIKLLTKKIKLGIYTLVHLISTLLLILSFSYK
jgi:hypothetical protein